MQFDFYSAASTSEHASDAPQRLKHSEINKRKDPNMATARETARETARTARGMACADGNNPPQSARISDGEGERKSFQMLSGFASDHLSNRLLLPRYGARDGSCRRLFGPRRSRAVGHGRRTQRNLR